jgi:hypothetical protein
MAKSVQLWFLCGEITITDFTRPVGNFGFWRGRWRTFCNLHHRPPQPSSSSIIPWIRYHRWRPQINTYLPLWPQINIAIKTSSVSNEIHKTNFGRFAYSMDENLRFTCTSSKLWPGVQHSLQQITVLSSAIAQVEWKWVFWYLHIVTKGTRKTTDLEVHRVSFSMRTKKHLPGVQRAERKADYTPWYTALA